MRLLSSGDGAGLDEVMGRILASRKTEKTCLFPFVLRENKLLTFA
jgi:hypothetical protein